MRVAQARGDRKCRQPPSRPIAGRYLDGGRQRHGGARDWAFATSLCVQCGCIRGETARVARVSRGWRLTRLDRAGGWRVLSGYSPLGR